MPVPTKKTKPKTNASFSVEDFTNENEGTKTIIYGPSGIGKTTLAAQLDKNVFIAPDDGGRNYANPITGGALKAIKGISSFQHALDALESFDSIAPDAQAITVDTISALELWAKDYVVQNFPKEKGGQAEHFGDYSWGNGSVHLFTSMARLLTKLDHIVVNGTDVVLLAQSATIMKANRAGDDYLFNVPKLNHVKSNPTNSIWSLYCEWADHVVYVDTDTTVKTEKGAKVGKASGSMKRRLLVRAQPHTFAKQCGLVDPDTEYISFDDPSDNSLWKFMSKGA